MTFYEHTLILQVSFVNYHSNSSAFFMISMHFYSYPCIMLKELDNLKKSQKETSELPTMLFKAAQ